MTDYSPCPSGCVRLPGHSGFHTTVPKLAVEEDGGCDCGIKARVYNDGAGAFCSECGMPSTEEIRRSAWNRENVRKQESLIAAAVIMQSRP